MQELEVLLLDPSHRIVNVHGAPGSGKTSLATAFSERHRDSFPGGRTTIVGSGAVDSRAILSSLSSDARSLLILDEVDRVPLSALTDAFARRREMRPLHGILTTSNLPVLMGSDTHVVAMPPLSAPQIIDLLARQSGVSPQRLEKLARILAGNLTAAEEASRRLASGMPAERIVEWFESGPLASARASRRC
jgi:replication-associated recombination protein RarA